MTYRSVITVLALVGLTNKRFGHHAILKNLSLRSLSISLRTSATVNLSLNFKMEFRIGQFDV